jgi:hypothetical protein
VRVVRGAAAVAGQASTYAAMGLTARPVLVNGVLGALSVRDGKPFSLGTMTVRGGRIVAMDIIADPEKLAALDPGLLP